MLLLSMKKSKLEIEDSQPEWCISSTIYSRDIPFWLETLEVHINSLNSESLKVGLKMHKGKTKYMTNHAESEDILIHQERHLIFFLQILNISKRVYDLWSMQFPGKRLCTNIQTLLFQICVLILLESRFIQLRTCWYVSFITQTKRQQ